MNDPDETVLPTPEDPNSSITNSAPSGELHQIGRYRVEKILGQGAFGLVYLAYDDQLNRAVAIKVPRPERLSRPQDADAYLAEARVVASLDHPNIVPIFDVGTTPDGLCYVVSKVIEGTDLAKKMQQGNLSHTQAATLTATVAEALHYAHHRGLVHRDIKPANILIDTSDKPYVADFGLALKEEDFGKGAKFAGTPAYMSPEQARGEGHRVDGRSDIFSLGVVLYEMLTGRRPFKADTQQELLEQITTVEVRPPRQVDDSVPRELDRICLKALSKRASERYSAATDMADDLRHFLDRYVVPASTDVGSVASVPQPPSTLKAAETTPPLATPGSDSQPIKIVPKGLRSFDAHDADFFLELLPGARDRDGLPDSIRFWKTRIEERDADNTFSVGLIYGPSGCGKSSLVKAGLLPRLRNHVITVYVEATAEDTETRLLHGLRKRCPSLAGPLPLTATLAALRRGQGIPAGKKVLIVLDQFEQWLHAKKEEQNTELVDALRQCDGGRLQCIVMVRDDFWLAVSRFLRELEIRLLEGQNSALADLFDIDHARRVLAAFGRAFGKLPENPSGQTKEQKQFLDQAVAGLAQEGKVISVRLALFAEMMKGKSWTPASLKAVGGTEGVGATFLEETFSAGTAPPDHRYHQKAARGVLKALLPESGTDIKGHMRSYAELLEASGHGNRPKDFHDLIRILDSEIRLITPTDPEGRDDDSVSQVQSGQKYYQLTHDYLVPSLRDWLTRKQKETRRGRAELLLADRAAVWSARPENRQLPSLWEWVQIRCWTAKKSWTSAQLKFMRKASKFHFTRTTVVAVLLALVGWGTWDAMGRLEARRLRDSLLGSTTVNVPGVINEIGPYRRWVDPLLRQEYLQVMEHDDEGRHLHISLALLPVDSEQVGYLTDRLLTASPEEMVVIRNALSGYKDEISERLWTLVEDPKHDQDQRFRAACALAVIARYDRRWEKVSGDVASMLVIQKPFVISQWTNVLQSVGRRLIPSLAELLVDEKRSVAERGVIANIYSVYASQSPDAYALLEQRLTESQETKGTDEAKTAFVKQRASIGLALMAMGREQAAWPLLKHSPDPAVRSFMIDRLGASGVDPILLIRRLDNEPEVSIRRAILWSLGEFGLDRLSLAERRNLLPRLLGLYEHDPDPGIHGAAEWLLRKWQAASELQGIDQRLATGRLEGERQWYINRQGQTMVIIPKPGEFSMGEGSEKVQTKIERSFAIAAKEVTVEQFLRFRKAHHYEKQLSPTDDCPIDSVSWHDAAEYCNWLSEREGIPKEQWCYFPNPEGKYDEGMTLAPDYLKRRGFRLPTEAEWEQTCRARADTGYCFGESIELLDKYAWFSVNSLSTTHPGGLLKSNDWGLFDMHGNMCEWCADWHGDKVPGGLDPLGAASGSYRVNRGGSWDNGASDCRSAIRHRGSPGFRSFHLGFRVAAVPSSK